MADFLAIAIRALGFVAALQAAGTALFVWLFGRDAGLAQPRVAQLGRRAATLGLLLLVAHQLVEPARLAGTMRGIVDGSLHALLLASDAGTAAAMRGLGLVMVLFGLREPAGDATGSTGERRAAPLVGVVGATLTAASFAFMGHTTADDQRWLLAPFLVVHLLAAAFWFGSLLPLHITSLHADLRANAIVIERFSAIAMRLVPGIFVAGLVLAVALVPGLAALGTPYGLLLVSKIVGFTLLMALAALNRWRFGPSISAGNASALHALGVTVRIEWLLIAAITVIAAVMTSLFSPTAH